MSDENQEKQGCAGGCWDEMAEVQAARAEQIAKYQADLAKIDAKMHGEPDEAHNEQDGWPDETPEVKDEPVVVVNDEPVQTVAQRKAAEKGTKSKD